MRPGYKTSEFWLSLAASLVGAMFASGLMPTDSIWEKVAGLAAMVLSSLGYTVARGHAKLGAGR